MSYARKTALSMVAFLVLATIIALTAETSGNSTIVLMSLLLLISFFMSIYFAIRAIVKIRTTPKTNIENINITPKQQSVIGLFFAAIKSMPAHVKAHNEITAILDSGHMGKLLWRRSKGPVKLVSFDYNDSEGNHTIRKNILIDAVTRSKQDYIYIHCICGIESTCRSFRTDRIHAMCGPDNEPTEPDEYLKNLGVELN